MFGQVIGTSASPQIHQTFRQVVAAFSNRREREFPQMVVVGLVEEPLQNIPWSFRFRNSFIDFCQMYIWYNVYNYLHLVDSYGKKCR